MKYLLLLLIFFIPLCIACKKEQAEPGEPLVQYHFINLVDESGENLFATNQISTSEFNYVSGDNKISWEELIADSELRLSEIRDEEFAQTVTELRKNNEYLLLEVFQGDRERIISINGVEYKFKMSPIKDGFYQDSKELQYSTDTIYDYILYLHHIVLEDY